MNCELIRKSCQKPVNTHFHLTEKYYRNTALLSRKDLYPHDYVDNITKFKETAATEGKFHSKLDDCDRSDEDYEHVQKVMFSFFLTCR